MAEIFISYVEDDSDIAHELAASLEEAGFTVWYYERDSLPGRSYTETIVEAIDQARAMVVIVSPSALGARQMDREIAEGHHAGKVFVPLLRDLTHTELTKRQRPWSMMFGSAVAVSIPREGIGAALPRLVRGLQMLGIQPRAPIDVLPSPEFPRRIAGVEPTPTAKAAADEAPARSPAPLRVPLPPKSPHVVNSALSPLKQREPHDVSTLPNPAAKPATDPAGSVPGDRPAGDIFISYVEEDSDIARELVDGLEQAGYVVWHYRRDSRYGHDYVEEIIAAINQAQVIFVILSPRTLDEPKHVDREINAGFSRNKAFMPLLHELDHATLAARKPTWDFRIGMANAASIPPEGVAAILPGLIRGLRGLGVEPH